MRRPFLILKEDCSEAVQWISDRLSQSGLDVVQTFDLQAARFDHGLCTCPHHGTDRCDCQMVVLLVYDNGSTPISIVAHGHDGQTCFTLVDSPRDRIQTGLIDAIQGALSQVVFLPLRPEEIANAS